MKTVIVREFGDVSLPDSFLLDLTTHRVRDCVGCWNCWLKTPGRCVHHDLDDFYRAYLGADKVIFFTKVSLGFVSGNLKSLFDRMIPHALPYIGYKTGESMHDARYPRYPDVEVYYEGAFGDEEERKIYEEYLARVFYQFCTKNTTVRPVSCYGIEEETT